MKKRLNKILLEAIDRGINLALDNFEDQDDIQLLTHGLIKNKAIIKDYLYLSHIAVDMGLPSGTWWCKYNLGVDENLLDTKNDWYGNYYQWGINSSDNYFTWSTYDYSEWTTRRVKYSSVYDEYVIIKLLKYCYDKDATSSTCDKPDNKMILDLEDDAAYKYDNRLCLPTNELFKELLKNCVIHRYKDYNHINGLNGFLLISKINENKLFFPCAGYMNEDKLCRDKTQGFYWTNSLSNKYQSFGNCLAINSSKLTLNVNESRRDQGCSIRPVIKW